MQTGSNIEYAVYLLCTIDYTILIICSAGTAIYFKKYKQH